MSEIWKEIRDRPGYEVSDQGRCRRWIEHRKEWRYYHESRPGTYAQIAGDYLHRHVWRTFKGDIEKGQIIRHLNDQRHDNRLVNLDIGTYSDNAYDKYRNNPEIRQKMSSGIKAAYAQSEVKARHSIALARPEVKARHAQATSIAGTKLTSTQVNQILADFNTNPVRTYARYDEIGKKYGINRQSIYRVISGTYVPKDHK